MQKVTRSFSPPLGFSNVMRLASSRPSLVHWNSLKGMVYLRAGSHSQPRAACARAPCTHCVYPLLLPVL